MTTILATTKQRLLQFIGYKNISQKKFLQEVGLKRGFLDTDKLNAAVSDMFIAKIIAVYAELNPEWLITGKGAMLRQPQEPVRERVGEEKSSAAQAVTSEKYYELLEQHVALQAKYAALLEKMSSAKDG
jgi:hypothetical protein